MKKDEVKVAVEPTQVGTEVQLKRSNKVTAYWQGEGVAVGVFYRTHDKIATVASTDISVITAGFTMPEGTEEAPVTAQQKLEAFKAFLVANASVFGIAYDPVDRRADAFKFPNRYDEANLLEFSEKLLEAAISDNLDSVNKNVVERMIKAGHLAEGTEVKFGIETGTVNVTESYANGGFKYATVEYPVILDVNGVRTNVTAVVELVSGQLKKPRQFEETVMTMTGVKELLISKGLLPKIEKEVKEKNADAEIVEAPAESSAEIVEA